MIDPKKPRILVALGGKSSERAVSIESGKQVAEALERLGYQTAILDVGTGKLLQTPEIESLEKDPSKLPKVSNLPLIDIKRHFELVFIAMHGRFGEDGGLQSLLEENGVAYTGSRPLPSALAMDKDFAKKIFKQADLPTLPHQVITNPDTKATIPYPLVVKANNQGSSIAVSICENEADFAVGLKQALEKSEKVIVEPYIKGREFTVAVLEDKDKHCRALPVIEIIPKNKFFDLKAKYDGTTQEIVPARIEKDLADRLQKLAVEAHQALGCRHFSRVDFMVDDNNNQYFLELNSIPGMTSESLLPKAAKASGLDFDAMIAQIVDISL